MIDAEMCENVVVLAELTEHCSYGIDLGLTSARTCRAAALLSHIPLSTWLLACRDT